MKKFLFYSFATAIALAAFTSCSDDDNDNDNSNDKNQGKPGSELSEQTYITGSDLALTLNGETLLGKTITFVPSEDGTAEITLAGAPLTLDFDAMVSGSKAGVAVPTAGVLPGSPSVTIPVVLEGDADNCTFSGSGETDYCTYSYSGSASADQLSFNLTDVKLKNQSLVGTWTLNPLYSDSSDEDSANIYNIIRLNWESSTEIDFGYGQTMEISAVAALALQNITVDFAGQSVPVLSALENVLKSVTFDEAGNVTATYFDTENFGYATAPTGFAQYVVTSDGNMKLYLNLQAIMAYEMTKSRAEDESASLGTLILGYLANMLDSLLPTAMDFIENGIPLHFGDMITSDGETSSAATSFYLGTETLLPLLKMAAPILKDENIVNAIIAKASQDESMASLSMMLPAILNAMPDVIENTTTVEIGINMKKN